MSKTVKTPAEGLAALAKPPVVVVGKPTPGTVAAAAPGPLQASAPVAKPAPTANPSITMVAVREIKPHPGNPRKHFDPKKLEEMAGSIRGLGVLEPLLLRPHAKGGFEIAAGERRWRASTLAGLLEVPAIVRALTDEELAEIQLSENIQRDDLTELEEARAYRGLIDSNPKKHSAGSIATRLGKSEKFVWDRMKLLNLTPPAMKLLEEGKMHAAHAIQIARLRPEHQKLAIDPADGGLWEHAAYDDIDDDPTDHRLITRLKDEAPYEGLKLRSEKELRGWIAHHIRFDPKQAAAAAPLLFGEIKAKVDQAETRPGRGKKVVHITHEYLAPDAVRRDGGEKVLGERAWRRADGKYDSKTCPHAVLGVVVAGPGYGEAFEVCTNKECDVHYAKEKAARARRRREIEKAINDGQSGKPGKKPAWQIRQERDNARWEADRKREKAEEERWKLALPRIIESVVGAIKKAPLALIQARATNMVYAPQVVKAKAALKPGTSAEDTLRLLILAELMQHADGGSRHDREQFQKEAGPFGGGIPAILKGVQTPAVGKPESAKASTPAKKHGAKNRLVSKRRPKAALKSVARRRLARASKKGSK